MSTCGSLPERPQIIVTIIAPIAAPSSTTPRKYARLRITAPITPPTSAVMTSVPVLPAPATDVASSAPRMKP